MASSLSYALSDIVLLEEAFSGRDVTTCNCRVTFTLDSGPNIRSELILVHVFWTGIRQRTTRFSETEIRRTWAGDPKGLELESGDPIYRFAKERFGYEKCEERESQMPSTVGAFLWSLGD